MRFDVTGVVMGGVDRSSVPTTIVETNNAVPASASLPLARLRTVQAGEMSPGMPVLGDAQRLLNWGESPVVTETPQLGSTEVWVMRNHSPDRHPIHEHLVELRLIGRWPVTQWSKQSLKTGQAIPVKVGEFQPPGAFESGPKDTFVAPKDYLTVWVGQYTIAGKSVWHCHILSHEDGMKVMMMRPLAVGTQTQTQLPVVGSQARLDQLIRQP